MLALILALLGKLFSNVWAWVSLGFLVLLACVSVQTLRLHASDNALHSCQTASAVARKQYAATLAQQNAAVDALTAQGKTDTAASQKALQAAESRRPTVVTKVQRIAATPPPAPGACQDKAIGSLIDGGL